MGWGTAGRPGWASRAQAILWVGDTLRLLGTNGEVKAEARRLGIEPVSLDGRIVVPGFVDAHTHFLHVGVKTTRPDLRGAKSLREALERVAGWLAVHPGAEPIIAEGWDESEWPTHEKPTKADLDGLVAAAAKSGDAPLDRPLVLRRICGHIAVASSGALPAIRARWDDDSAVDLASGLLLEAPSLYLNEVLPSTAEQLDRAVQEACREAHRVGVTAVGDYSQAPYRLSLLRAAARGSLAVRTFSSIYVQQLEAEIAVGFRTGRPSPGHAGGPSPWIRDGGLKVFLDGSLGAHTAHLREAYLDEPDLVPQAKGRDPHAGHGHGGPAAGRDTGGNGGGRNKGNQIWTDEQLDQHFGTAHTAGIQVHAHAIGDAAIDQGLDAFERLGAREDLEGHGWQVSTLDQGTAAAGAAAVPSVALRHRFEHFEIVHDDQVRRTSALGIVASSQPNFVGEWSAKGGLYEARLGARYKLNNRFRSFKEAGIPLAFGSDGMPFGPLVGLASAIGHPDPAQRMSPAEAVWHYTTAAAWAIHWEDSLGALRPAMKADLVMLPVGALESPQSSKTSLLSSHTSSPNSWSIEATVSGGVLRHSTFSALRA